ncbi:MAG: XrtA system polysaccharide deacetylase [Pseudomonadota bacterium]
MTQTATARPDAPTSDVPTPNAMSVDVEDYYQVWALSFAIKREDWDDIAPRVVEATTRVLDLFDRTGAKGTFFALGCVAERHPDLIRDIVGRGHELGSHGYDHKKVFDLSQDAFLEETRRTRTILEDIAGVEARGYRAAGFSIDERTPWAHEMLMEAGHAYSSSIHPIDHDHYSAPDAPLTPYRPVAGADFAEIPVGVAELFGRRITCAGGGRFRLWPTVWTASLIDRVNRKDGRSAVFYFHPWEVDPDQPKVDGLPWKSRFRHYVNLDRMEGKLEALCRRFVWDRIDRVFPEAAVGAPNLKAAE